MGVSVSFTKSIHGWVFKEFVQMGHNHRCQPMVFPHKVAESGVDLYFFGKLKQRYALPVTSSSSFRDLAWFRR